MSKKRTFDKFIVAYLDWFETDPEEGQVDYVNMDGMME